MWCGRCELCCYRLSAITIKVQPLRMANKCRFALRQVWTLLKISWWRSASTVMLSGNSQCRKCTSYSFRSFHQFTKSRGLSKQDTPCGLFPQNSLGDDTKKCILNFFFCTCCKISVNRENVFVYRELRSYFCNLYDLSYCWIESCVFKICNIFCT